MAIYKPGALVSEVRGKVGGVVFARNKGGMYIRNFAAPINRRTPLQAESRQFLTDAIAGWRDLTEPARLAWGDYGREVGTFNSLGEKVTISGMSAYVAGATLLLVAGGAVPSGAPVEFSLPPIPAIEDVEVIGATPDPFSTGGNIDISEIDASGGGSINASGGFVVVTFSGPHPVTRISPAGLAFARSQWGAGSNPPTVAAAISGPTWETGPMTILANPASVVPGMAWFVRARTVTSDGRVSAYAVMRAIGAAGEE